MQFIVFHFVYGSSNISNKCLEIVTYQNKAILLNNKKGLYGESLKNPLMRYKLLTSAIIFHSFSISTLVYGSSKKHIDISSKYLSLLHYVVYHLWKILIVFLET